MQVLSGIVFCHAHGVVHRDLMLGAPLLSVQGCGANPAICLHSGCLKGMYCTPWLSFLIAFRCSLVARQFLVFERLRGRKHNPKLSKGTPWDNKDEPPAK